VTLFLLASIALVLSAVAVTSCRLVQPTVFDLGNFFGNAPDSLGLSCYVTNNGDEYDITNVNDNDNDRSMLEAARKFGIVSLCLGSLVVLFYIMAAVFKTPARWAFWMVAALGLGTCLLHGLIFLVYKSDFCAWGCAMDSGGSFAIAAIVIWFLTALTSLAVSDQ
jgi:hypothetical protein